MVDEEAGLGRYDGIEDVAGVEAIRLVHEEDEASLVPVAEADRLWRYGRDEGGTALDALGGSAWPRRRAALARKIAAAAAELAEAAKARREATAAPLTADGDAHAEVVAGFGHEETPDQAAAIRDVTRDLASGRPMDRLLIGDVGFGKTEVAIRAIAVAALAGAQAALVAPTTVLARQHAGTLARRLGAAGIEVAQLSRLTAPGEAKRVRAGLADGSIRVVVGTHALLGKSVAFDGLGLVVIDEEQRFGTAHKRALRDLASGVHVLSMTATPIPGSLQRALAGLQEIAVLATPPDLRRPVRTQIATAAPDAMGEALRRERRRGGQSFVVVPRIEDVEAMRAAIAEAAPGLSVRVAHGDLPAREIDEAMTAFADGDGDVLLATAIVESGLDVPRANTMLIARPELMGLAQLHQLRGRVGRGGRQAYCTLMTDPDAPPGEGARARLEAFVAADALGAGFALSMVDLDRRGAGDLLGDGQSGHDARVGAALHAEMLAYALREAEGRPPPVRPDLRIEAAAGLPADYVTHEDARATLHLRLAHVRTAREADALAEEVADRFGPPPSAARALLTLTAIRAHAAEAGIARVTAGPSGVALDLVDASREVRLPEGAERSGDRIVLRRELPDEGARLDAALGLVDALAALAEDA